MKCRVLKGGNCYITQNYSQSHKSIDLVALIDDRKTTDTVVAHTDGKVIAVQSGKKNSKGSTGLNSYGNYVQIEHNNGYTTLYAHLKTVDVKVGQQVKKGQSIGYMGDTGNAYGEHLHFEIRKNVNYSSAINPNSYLNANLPGMVENKKSISYRVYSNKQKKWLGTVKDGQTSGNSKDIIGGIQIKTENAGSIKYRAHLKNGAWLPTVTKWDNTYEGYAGIKGKSMDAITISSEKGKLSYRAKTKKDGWLPWVTKYGIKNYDEYAGMLGEDILAIQIKII